VISILMNGKKHPKNGQRPGRDNLKRRHHNQPFPGSSAGNEEGRSFHLLTAN
jgi:hypothetical protein